MTEVEQKIGYQFRKKILLQTALTHSSYANENKKESNERLEFLGDSVLSILVSDYIFHHMPHVDEGELTRVRAALVCEQSLAGLAKKIELGSLLMLGKGEEQTGGRTRASIVSDAFEAVLAAIYLDGGMESAKKWLMNLMQDAFGQVVNEKDSQHQYYHDYKTMLQEIVQKDGSSKVTYQTISETGQEHDKLFEVEVYINEDKVNTGAGPSKKEAEQQAAKAAIEQLNKNENL
jgi:ribonuclease-3